MFKCNKCRQTFDGDPTMKTGKALNILWCFLCSEEWKESSRNALQKRNEQIAARNRCLWCDDVLTDQNRFKKHKHSQEYRSNMCVRCDWHSTERQWLEKCLSNSTTLERYINNPDRQKKWKESRQNAQARKERLIRFAQESEAAKAQMQLIQESRLNPDDQKLYQEFLQFKAFMTQNKGSR